jgi:hypothetical protein
VLTTGVLQACYCISFSQASLAVALRLPCVEKGGQGRLGSPGDIGRRGLAVCGAAACKQRLHRGVCVCVSVWLLYGLGPRRSERDNAAYRRRCGSNVCVCTAVVHDAWHLQQAVALQSRPFLCSMSCLQCVILEVIPSLIVYCHTAEIAGWHRMTGMAFCLCIGRRASNVAVVCQAVLFYACFGIMHCCWSWCVCKWLWKSGLVAFVVGAVEGCAHECVWCVVAGVRALHSPDIICGTVQLCFLIQYCHWWWLYRCRVSKH